jgi:hypothetical protein
MSSVNRRRFPSRDSYATWLFAFLYADFTTMTPGQELDWREGALEFADLVGTSVFERARGGGLATDNLPTMAILRALQDKLRTGLDAGWRGTWEEPQPRIAAIARLDKGYVRRGDRAIWKRVYRTGSFRVLFVATIWDVLIEAGSRIYTCPQCSRYFLKSRKQEYCSPVCSQKARWARFASTRPARDYRREREQAIKRRLGPHSRVHPQKRQG